MIRPRMYAKWQWADEPIVGDGLDPADYKHIGRLRLSRSYGHASDREVTWRHVRGTKSTPSHHAMNGEQWDSRNANWDRESQAFAEQLAENAKIKHDFAPLGKLGYCSFCGEREDARIEEIGYGTAVMRRVHTNPALSRVA